MTITNDQITNLNDHHNHEPENDFIMELKLKNKMKENTSSNPTKSVHQVYNDVVTKKTQELNLNANELVKIIPVFENIKDSLYKVKHKFIPPNPSKRADLVLNGNWIKTNDKKDFLLIDDGQEDKILVFGTLEFLQKLCNCKTIFMDGTFYISPEIFSQMYTLHGFYRGQMMFFICFITKQN